MLGLRRGRGAAQDADGAAGRAGGRRRASTVSTSSCRARARPCSSTCDAAHERQSRLTRQVFGALFGTDEMRALFARRHSCRRCSTSRPRWRAPRRGSASSRRRRPMRSRRPPRSTASTSPSSAPARAMSAIPSSALVKALGRAAGKEAAALCPLGRHHAGHHRHRARAADARRPRAHRARPRRASARALAETAQAHRDTVMAGRTHLQHALPVTFGYKCAVWLAPLLDHLDAAGRAAAARAEGAVRRRRRARSPRSATRAAPSPRAWRKELGLAAPASPWHVSRERIVETGALARPRLRQPRQDRHRRHPADADRDRRGQRAAPGGPRRLQHHAAEAQSRSPANTSSRRRAACTRWCRCCSRPWRRPRARHRPVAERAAGAAADLRADRAARWRMPWRWRRG